MPSELALPPLETPIEHVDDMIEDVLAYARTWAVSKAGLAGRHGERLISLTELTESLVEKVKHRDKWVSDQAMIEAVFRPKDHQGVAQDPPLIRRREGLMGGSACVRDTRIPVWQIMDYAEKRMTSHAICGQFGHGALSEGDVHRAIEFNRRFPNDIINDRDRNALEDDPNAD